MYNVSWGKLQIAQNKFEKENAALLAEAYVERQLLKRNKPQKKKKRAKKPATVKKKRTMSQAAWRDLQTQYQHFKNI